jgi:hypothetical protein
MESPRLWQWNNRLKLPLMASLAYAFLLSLLVESKKPLVEWVLRFFCHRTEKKNRRAKVPLYRIRSAISRLWIAFSNPQFSDENPG